MPVFVRASSRAKAYTRRGGSALARDKKIASMLHRMDDKRWGSGLSPAQASRYNKLGKARIENLKVLNEKTVSRGSYRATSLKKNARRYKLISKKY